MTIETYVAQTAFHNVQRFVLERAVKALLAHGDRLEALALIRGVCGASLSQAREILSSIEASA